MRVLFLAASLLLLHTFCSRYTRSCKAAPMSAVFHKSSRVLPTTPDTHTSFHGAGIQFSSRLLCPKCAAGATQSTYTRGDSDQPYDPSMAALTNGMHLYSKLFTRTSPASAGAAYTQTVRPIYILMFDVASAQALLLVVATRHTHVDKL
jgi:hypothetical protein